jgi:hypothetical protein
MIRKKQYEAKYFKELYQHVMEELSNVMKNFGFEAWPYSYILT